MTNQAFLYCNLRAFGKLLLNKSINLILIIINPLITVIVKPHLGNTGGDDKQGIDEVSVRHKLRNSSTKINLTLFMTNTLNIHPKIFLSFLIG